MDTKHLEQISRELRIDVIKMLNKAGSGHTAGSLGMADIFTALYFDVLNINPQDPTWDERDILVLSNGHICPIWYATLSKKGYFHHKELFTLRQLGSRLQGHPHYNPEIGIENTSGPLGQGVSFAVGVALARKLKNKNFNVFCITSDGEQEEGQVWEAYMFAVKHQLDITFILDRNHIQIDGTTDIVSALEPLKQKFEAFGMQVFEIDGHNFDEIINTLNKVKEINMPVMVIANTIPGKGVPFMENKYEWHGKTPNDEEMNEALMDLE